MTHVGVAGFVWFLINILIRLFNIFSSLKECGESWQLERLDVGILMDIDKEAKTIPKNVGVTLKMYHSKDLHFDKVLHHSSLHLPGGSCM